MPYTYLNRPTSNLLIMSTPIDSMIPLIPSFVTIYAPVFYFVFSLTIVTVFFRGRLFKPFALALITANLVAYFFYIFMQTYVARPIVTGDDIYSNMLRFVYESDAPYNAFPSLHMAISAIMVATYYKIRRGYGYMAFALMVLVAMSTFFLKQHYIPDALLGTVLGFSAFTTMYKIVYRKK